MRYAIGRCRLLDILKNRKMSQAEFARRMDTHPQTVQKWVKGEAVMLLITAYAASQVLGCKMEELYEFILYEEAADK